MKLLWPRLPQPIADSVLGELNSGRLLAPSDSHPAQVYGQVGGRVGAQDIVRLQEEMRVVASQFGFGTRAPSRDERVAFDRAAATRLRDSMDIAWSEAGSRDVWSFVALVALPDVTDWRWAHTLPVRNRERWVASDLTRHTWARLWWQVTAFEHAPQALDRLNESELNQFLERRSIGGHPRLLGALASEALAAIGQGVPRRPLIRDTTRRLRRRLAYIDDHALNDQQLAAFAKSIVHESWRQLSSQSPEEWAKLGLDTEDQSDPL